MELFRNPNIDFLGKKWYFLAFSLIFSVAGVFSMLFWHHIPLGIDFSGGTLVEVKFTHSPDDNAIRSALDRAGLEGSREDKGHEAATAAVATAVTLRDVAGPAEVSSRR